MIQRETDRLEHLRDVFPSSWFAIKQHMEDSADNYVGFDKYRTLCAGLGEYDPASQNALAGYLHSLGIALNYRDDPRLQDTHILNPHWVTNAIYTIINSPRLERQKGEITLQHAGEILPEAIYPSSMTRFIFDLMRKFDLCFSFPEDDSRYLVPDLLDKQEPEDASIFDIDDCLTFEYEYPVLPEGLLPRFIVRTHVLSEGMSRWRTGVLLRFEANVALVKADIQDKRVSIFVGGVKEGRRRLLAIIRSDFERIHREIRNLQPKGMVPIPGLVKVSIPYEDLILWENAKRAVYSVRVAGEIIDLSVEALLNDVELSESRLRKGKTDVKAALVGVFVSYAHKDEIFRQELETHLKLLHHQGLIQTWTDANIEAGEAWSESIRRQLEEASMIVLLVSADFIASDYCYHIEMEGAIGRHEAGDAVVIPVIVRDVKWKTSSLGQLQPYRGVGCQSQTGRIGIQPGVALRMGSNLRQEDSR